MVSERPVSPIIDHFSHPVEVDQQTQEDFVGSGAVLVDAAEVA